VLTLIQDSPIFAWRELLRNSGPPGAPESLPGVGLEDGGLGSGPGGKPWPENSPVMRPANRLGSGTDLFVESEVARAQPHAPQRWPQRRPGFVLLCSAPSSPTMRADKTLGLRTASYPCEPTAGWRSGRTLPCSDGATLKKLASSTARPRLGQRCLSTSQRSTGLKNRCPAGVLPHQLAKREPDDKAKRKRGPHVSPSRCRTFRRDHRWRSTISRAPVFFLGRGHGPFPTAQPPVDRV